MVAKRELTSHKVNGLNETLRVEVLDEPGPGGANHLYSIRCTLPVSEQDQKTWDRAKASCDIRFQNGPIDEVGVNGISQEALLAIVEDRLLGFQSGKYACRENALALTALQECIMWLQKRTRERVARGVEGTSAV
jgi:hypothetical protein